MKSHNAILLTPEVVRGVVIKDVPGVYLLGNASMTDSRFQIHYIGRSDVCLQRRLRAHNHLGECEYFVHIPCANVQEAFFLECYLWHALYDRPELLNRIHPDSPDGTGMECPLCSTSRAFASLVKTRESV